MKTRTIARFEKDLRENGFDYKVAKELTNKTRYVISKDGHSTQFEAHNLLDRPIEQYRKIFKQLWDLELEIEQLRKEAKENGIY